MAKQAPSWDIRYWNTSREKTRRDLNGEAGIASYYSNTKAFGHFLRGDKGLERELNRNAHAVRRTLASYIPIGKNSRDGHMKHQVRVTRIKGNDGRIAFAVYVRDGHKDGDGMAFWNAEWNRERPRGNRVKKPMWTKQALRELEI